VRVVIAIACNQLGKKKEAEVADNQHVRQPRQVIPVSHIIGFEIALQMLFDFFAHDCPRHCTGTGSRSGSCLSIVRSTLE